jgi:hypothetical protein
LNSFSQEADKLIKSFEECDTSENSREWLEKMLNKLFQQYVSLGICESRTEFGEITYEVFVFSGEFFIYQCD